MPAEMTPQLQRMIDDGIAEDPRAASNNQQQASENQKQKDSFNPVIQTSEKVAVAAEAPALQNNSAEFQSQLKSLLKEKFGADTESLDTVHERFNSLKSAEDNYKKQNDILNLRLKNGNEFANDEVAEYNGFVKATGITNFSVFSKLKKLDLEQVKSDPLSVMLAERQIQDPE